MNWIKNKHKKLIKIYKLKHLTKNNLKFKQKTDSFNKCQLQLPKY